MISKADLVFFWNKIDVAINQTHKKIINDTAKPAVYQ